MYGYGPSGSLVSSSQNKVISWILMFVDDVNNARCHDERKNSKDNREGLEGPTDGLIQHPLLIQEARIIGHLWAPSRNWDGMKR